MTLNQLILPLANEISGGGWADQFFAAIRQKSIAHASVITSIATSLACIFIAFKFIKMYYDLVSDEQSGGFGGVRMWDILRPLTILIMTMTFGTWLPWLDSACSAISSSLTATLNKNSLESEQKLEEQLMKYQDEINKDMATKWEESIDEATKSTGTSATQATMTIRSMAKDILGDEYTENAKYYMEDNTLVKEYVIGRSANTTKQTFSLDDLANSKDSVKVSQYLSKMNNEQEKLNEVTQMTNDIYASKTQLKKFLRWANKGGSLVGTIFKWLFNIIFVVMMAFADLMLCLLAIFGPLAAAISILDPWKQSFSSWMGHYIEVSLWKPIGAAICWVVSTVNSSVGELGITQALGMTPEAGKATLLGAVGAQCLIFFAGLMAMTNVPSLTNTILSLGNMSDQFTNSAANTTHSAMSAPMKGVQGAQKMVSSHNSKIASKEQVGQIKKIADAVNKMAGK